DRRSPAHLARETDGDLYWVDYRREDARCDFVRLAAAPGAAPEVLFSDALGDFSEMGCATDLAVDDARLYWLHGDEIRAASHASAQPTIEILARGERYPRELAVGATHVYWTTLGADPYEDDLTRRGALRALPLAGGRARTVAARLTEPNELTLDGSEITLIEQSADGEQLRRYPITE
ncbi:MAG: hypothetical protein M3Y87_10945, partial [Myxococcota bacterium]|nr:hypothetical protein [Myxococcota bacterium]